MTCFRDDPEYQAMVAGTLAISSAQDANEKYTHTVARCVSEKLRLKALDGSGAPSWAVDAVMWDVRNLVRSKKRSHPTPRRNEDGFLDIEFEFLRGGTEPRFRYGDYPYFTIEISLSTLRVTFDRYDESGEYWGEHQEEEELDFLVDAGVGEDQITELQRRAYAVVDYAINKIKAELLTRHRHKKPHTQPSTFQRDKEIAAALVGFLLGKSRLLPSGCPGPNSRDTVKVHANDIGIELPRS
jgi:hypothetical protein